MPISTRLGRWMLAVLCTTLITSCSSTITPVKTPSFTPKSVTTLQPGHGYMLMAITTNQAVSYLQIDGPMNVLLTPGNLMAGTNYVLISLQQGQYYLSRLRRYQTKYDFEKDEYWSFDIEPGKINYVGDLNLKINGWIETSMEHNFTNRSSFALEFLETNYSSLINTTSIVYSGFGEDQFLELMSANNDSTYDETSAQGDQAL